MSLHYIQLKQYEAKQNHVLSHSLSLPLIIAFFSITYKTFQHPTSF